MSQHVSVHHDLSAELGLEQEHELVQRLGWDSPWLESVLVKSEQMLQLKRHQRSLDVIATLDLGDPFGSVIDLVLLTFERDLTSHAEAFYAGEGPPLKELYDAATIRKIDENLAASIRRLTYEYERCRRMARRYGLSERAVLATVVRNLGLVPPRLVAGRRAEPQRAPDDGTDRGIRKSTVQFPRRFISSLSHATVFDSRTGITWQSNAAPVGLSFDEARAYASNLALDGATWRLPSRAELTSLFGSGSLVTEARKVFGQDLRGWYWTHEADARDRDLAWAVSFSFFEARTCLRTTKFRVRCVR